MVKKKVNRRAKRGKPKGIRVQKVTCLVRRSRDGRILGYASKPKKRRKR